MKIDVLTLFPEMFSAVLSESILRIAREKGLLDVRLWDIREFTSDRHRSADDRPYGGGAGMVLKPEPVIRCVEHVRAERGREDRAVLLSPQGRRFDQSVAPQRRSVQGSVPAGLVHAPSSDGVAGVSEQKSPRESRSGSCGLSQHSLHRGTSLTP